MSIAALLALLIASGACAETRFTAPDGATLGVIICPRTVAPAPADAAPEAEPEPAQPFGPSSLRRERRG